MTKVYFTVPLVGLLLFIAAYTWSRSGHAERERVRQEQLASEHQARLDAERSARDAAIAEALKAQAARKAEREVRQARETAAREQREAALDARDRTYREQEKLTRDLERLRRETATEQEAVTRLELNRDADLAEKASLEKQVPQLRANATALETVLQKIATAEAARLQAATKPKS
jgi:chromosome segregation ATPase